MGKKSVEEKKDSVSSEKPLKKQSTKVELPEEPPKPDKTAHEAAVAVIEKEIEALKEEKEKFHSQIEERQVGKPEYEEKKKSLQADFEKAKDHFEGLRKSLYDLTDEVKRNKEAGFNSKRELKTLQGSIEKLDEAGIDRQIKSIEMKMHTTSMSLQQEKAAMKEIAELKKKRPEVQRMAAKLAALKKESEKAGEPVVNLEEKIQEVKKQIETAKAEKDSKKELLNQLTEERKAKNGDIKGIIEKRDKIKEEIKGKQDAKWELKKEFDGVSAKHRKWQQECRKIQQKAREERENREWEAWEAEKKKQELEKAAEKPYFEEMTLLEQTIDYCKSILKEEGLLKDEEVEKKDSEKKLSTEGFDAPEGAMVMLSKKDRDEEMYIVGKKKSFKGGNKEKKKPKNIKHNAGTFALFTKLKVSAPMTVDDVPSTLEKLEAEMEVFNGKIAEWEEQRKEKEAELKKLESETAAAQEA